ncbi:ABC transporter ATP-binding protein [bacterium D16-51]|nr:ABC transporter ATP-binding protein [bacterium D16-59]RKI57054.1 ABC transporter ATP-binding protein [bacterium D16-51]
MQNNAGAAKEKLPISRILSNYVYLLKYAFGKDAGLILMIFFSFISAGVGYACMDTVFMRAFINYLSDDSYTFHQTAVLVALATIGMAFLMAVERCTESFAQPRIIRMSGMMQEEMIKKAVTMDLVCYDCDTYYDDFVVAASQLEDMVITAVFDLARMGRNVTTVLVLSGLITVIDPVIAIFPVLGFLVNMFSRFRIMKLEYDYDVEKKEIMRRANYSKRVFYQPEYAKEIKLSHIEIPLEKQFHQAVDETITVSKKYGVRISLWSLVNWITVFTFLSMFCVPLYLGYMALVACSIGLGDVAALNKAQSTMRNQLDSVNYCVERIQRAGLFCERFRKFMNYESKIEKAQGTVQVPKSQSVLEIKDMSFRYDGAKKDTLKHINMKIQAGQKVAFVGENGAGKSTFIKLLMRLYDVTEGSICYGGHDIREYSTEEYRDIFGSVFQDYQIYAASVQENVMMQNVAAPGQELVEAALEQSGFSERLNTLPNGVLTSLTREFAEDGVQLSGGEAQKVAIARLFAKKERMHIAILDEPSSALDPKAEYELNQNILNKAEDATVIFISHRLSTTRDADCIYMFENGEIIEQGTHQELMEKNGQYADMFRCQAKYYQQNQEIIC